jgi:hypothetical protein
MRETDVSGSCDRSVEAKAMGSGVVAVGTTGSWLFHSPAGLMWSYRQTARFAFPVMVTSVAWPGTNIMEVMCNVAACWPCVACADAGWTLGTGTAGAHSLHRNESQTSVGTV